MQVSYARTPLQQSIFLAGPTPRDANTPSWRPEALEILKNLGFTGTVFVPEDSDGSKKFSYDDQIEWELQALHSATCVLFWVPRELEHMPAMVTNVEFGHFVHRPNTVLGYPLEAPKMKYLHGLANLHGITVRHTLHSTIIKAMYIASRPFITS